MINISIYASLTAAITAIGSTETDLLIASATTCTANTTIPDNIRLIITRNGRINQGAYTLTINGPFEAGLSKVFTGTGTVTFGKNVGRVFPEWWGALPDDSTDNKSFIQSAIDSISANGGIVELSVGTYRVSDYISFTKDNVGMYGKGQWASILKSTSSTADIIRVTGISTSGRVNYVTLKKFGTYRTDTNPTSGYGINAKFTAHLKAYDVTIDASNGMYFDETTTTKIVNCIVNRITGTTTFYGFYFNGAAWPSGNLSINLDNCGVCANGHSGISYGYYIYGQNLSDIWLEGCETSQTDYGIWIEEIAAQTNIDIHIMRAVLDSYSQAGIVIKNCKDSSAISIVGGYTNPANTGATTYGIKLDNCRGVSVSGMQFIGGPNYAYATGLFIGATSGNVRVQNCALIDNKYGIEINNSHVNSILGNSFFNISSRPASSHIWLNNGSGRNAICSNVFDGYATNGLLIDSGSTYCAVIGNCTDPTHITNPIVNNGGATNDIQHNPY